MKPDPRREVFPNVVDVTIRHDETAPAPGQEDDRSWTRLPTELFEEYLRDKNIEDPRLTTLFGELLQEVDEADAA